MDWEGSKVLEVLSNVMLEKVPKEIPFIWLVVSNLREHQSPGRLIKLQIAEPQPQSFWAKT